MSMTFLIAGLLIAVPIIIHLFNRTRYRRIDWAAMEFLLNAYRKTRRRMRFENLLLLLLRVLAMAMLAFAFFPQGVESAAKWFLDSTGISLTKGADVGRAQHLILVIDDTASMRYREMNVACHARAGEIAAELLGQLKDARDRVTIIRAGDVRVLDDAQLTEQQKLERLNKDIYALTVKKAQEVLGQFRAGYGAGDMLGALREAGRRISGIDGERETPQLAVISDFQTGAWAFAETGHPGYESFHTLMKEVSQALGNYGAVMSIHDVGEKQTRNRAILDVRLENPVAGVGISNVLSVTIGNYGSGQQFPKDIKLQFRIDQGEARPFTADSVGVMPGNKTTISQPLPPFQTAGSHTVQVELTDKDSFEEDNSRVLAINVIKDIPILIINGDPRTEGDVTKDEVVYLKTALDISTGKDDIRITPNRVSVVPVRALSTTTLSDYAVVVLANVGAPPQTFVDSLYDYLEVQGGTVLIALGDKVNADVYNTLFWRDGKGLLPARLATVQGYDRIEGAASPLCTIKGVDLNPSSPMKIFGESDATRALLEQQPLLRKWYKVETPLALKLENADPAHVSLAVQTEGVPPLLIDRPYGHGHVMLWTSTVDGDWLEWSERVPFWLFHECVDYLAAHNRTGHNLLIGDTYLRVLAESELTGRGNAVESPTGAVFDVEGAALPDGKRKIVFPHTAVPGVYKLNFLAADDSGQKTTARTDLFTAALVPAESDVKRLGGTLEKQGDPGRVLKDGLAGVRFIFEQKSDADVGAASQAPADRMDLWLLFVGMAAVFLLAEMGASIYFGRRAE